jgi:hypothetical protein
MGDSYRGLQLKPFGISIVATSLALVASGIGRSATALRQQSAPAVASIRSAVLVELFTSEGCSSCPAADELLRQISGRMTPEGQLIVGISEHVSYWNHLGWKDPFSSELLTDRQSKYSEYFGLSSVYTPQMVVNGREQFVGSDRSALAAAFASESGRRQIDLRITSAQLTSNRLDFAYSASDLPADSRLDVFAVVVDDLDHSNVSSGENSGRQLFHSSVARAFVSLGEIRPTEGLPVSLPLPSSFTGSSSSGHHLVLFAQEPGGGPVRGVDTRPI